MCFTVQLSRFSFVHCRSRQLVYYITFKTLCQQLFSTFFISLSCFCCDSVASCDSSYRIPRYSYNVNPKIWLFSKIWLFQNLFKFFNSSSISHYDKEYITPSIFFAMYSPFYKLPHWFFQIYLFPFFSSLRHSTINSVGSKKAVSRYIHKHRATLTSTTPRL